MSFAVASTDRILIGGTLLSILALPLLAASPDAWPGLVGLSFAATLALVVLWRRDPVSRREVLWGALLLRLAFLPLLPGLSDDLYRYLWDGWMQVEGINPYRYVPESDALASYQSSVLFERMNSPAYYTVYPPLAQLVFAVGGAVHAVLGWPAGYYVLKGVLATAELGGVLLLSRLVSARCLLLYAWNPIVLLETAGQGHTEALLVPCLVAVLWAVRQGNGRLASAAVAGAGLVKIYPFVLGPFLLRRFGWRAVWPGALTTILLCLPFAAPYTLPHLKASVDLFSQLFEFNAGLYYLTKYGAWLVSGADWSKVIGPAFRYAYLGLLPVLYVLDWTQDWSFRRAALMAFGGFLILSTTVHPWYFLPVLILSVSGPRPTWAWLWVAGLSIGTYLFYVDGPYWTWIILGWGGGAAIGIRHFVDGGLFVRRAAQLLPGRLPVHLGGQERASDS